MKTATVRIRIFEKATHRTYLAHFGSGGIVCVLTGTKKLVQYAPGYSEYNDRGEPVLDSWVVPERCVAVAA